MKKLITILTKVMKVWNFKLNLIDAYTLVDKAFAKLDKDGSKSIELKDIILETWELYQVKKNK